MEKISTFIKKHDNISVIIVIIFTLLGICLNVNIYISDELWNYQNICKMLNGYKIYTDANVIVTPLFHFIGFIILKIFGTNILVFRIYNILILTFVCFFIYLIIKELCNSKFRAFTYLLVILYEIISIAPTGANYNTLAMGFVLLGTYLNLKWIKNKETHNIIQSIIMFLVLFTKQNIGVFYIIGISISQILINKNIKDIFKQAIFLLIEIGITIIVFLNMGIFNDFINYALLGMSEFVQRNIIGDILAIIKVFSFMMIALIIGIFIINKKLFTEDQKNKLIILIALAIIMLLISFPICNIYHETISMILIEIFIIYVLDIFILKDFLQEIKLIKSIVIVITLIYVIISFILLCVWTNKIIYKNQFESTSPYYGGFLEKDLYKNLNIIDNYILNNNKKVVIFSDRAALYMIPLKRNNGDIDLPYLGNMGANGEANMIKKIINTTEVQFLIKSNENELSVQESKIINNFIRENLTYIGQIEEFDIYEK